MRANRVFALLAAAALGGGCGSTSADDDVDGGDIDAGVSADAFVADATPPDAMPDPTLEDLCGEDGGYAEFFAALLDCNPEFEFLLGRFPTAAEISAACYGNFEDYFNDGSMSLGDAETWVACLDYIANLDCVHADFDSPNPCSGLIIGHQSEGDDCENSDQCAGDAYCDWSSSAGSCGECAPLKGDWQVCDESNECLSGHCSGVTDPRVCRPFGFAGELCVDDEDCTGRLFCNDDEPRLCEEPQVWAIGDDCSTAAFENTCGFPFTNLHCDVTALGGDNTCTPYLAVGDECGSLVQCDFKHYETCDTDATGKCLAPTIVGEDADCSWAAGTMCDTGLRCTIPHEAGGTCVPEPAVGDACENSDECGILMECDSSDECAYGDYSAMCPVPA